MENEIEIIEDVRPCFFRSAVACAPFDWAYRRITNNPPCSLEMISLERNVQLRMLMGSSHEVSREGNLVREGVIYFPNGTPKLVSYSPILRRPEEATEGHDFERGICLSEFYPSESEIETALKNSTDFPRERTEILTRDFGSNSLTRFAFGFSAEPYAQLLESREIHSLSIIPFDPHTVDLRGGRPFVTQVYFGGLFYYEEQSCLDASENIYLSENQRVRGIKLYNTVPASNSNPTAYKG